MINPKKEEENKNLKLSHFKFKTAEFTKCFKKIYNEYLKHQKNKDLQLKLILNPNKLFIDEIIQKKRELYLKKENMNIENDLFDGKKIDIDEERYLNYNSKNRIRLRTKTTKISQFLLFKTNKKFKKNKRKSIHKSFSQNLFSNNVNKKILQFPKIFSKEKSDNKNTSKKKRLIINTNNFDNNKISIKRPLKERRKSILDLNYYMNNNFPIFNPYKTKYYNKMKSLTIESKQLAKNLSHFSLKGKPKK